MSEIKYFLKKLLWRQLAFLTDDFYAILGLLLLPRVRVSSARSATF
jgi:hypothetical protein